MYYIVYEFVRCYNATIDGGYTKEHIQRSGKYHNRESADCVCDAMNRVNEDPNSDYRVLIGIL